MHGALTLQKLQLTRPLVMKDNLRSENEKYKIMRLSSVKSKI